jgi:hypothetical protein
MVRIYRQVNGGDIVVVNGAGKAKPLPHIMQHSLLLMQGGNTGNSGHDLALSILTDYMSHAEHMDLKDARMYAGWLHHMFCLDFVAGWNHGDWSITAADIKQFVDSKPRTIETVNAT